MIEKLPELHNDGSFDYYQRAKLNELIDVVNALDKMVLHPDIPQDYLKAYCLCSGQDFQGNCIQCGRKKLKAQKPCDHKWKKGKDFFNGLVYCSICGAEK